MKIFPAGFSAFGCFFQTTFPAQCMRKKFCRLLYFMQFRQGGESEVRSALDAKKGIGLKPQWTNEQAKAQRIEYAAGAPKPMKLTRAEAQALERERSKIKTDSPETLVVRKNILSPEYRRHFDEFGENANVTSVMCRKSREILSHRTGTLYEDLVFIDSATGRCKVQKNYNVKQQVIPTKAMKEMVTSNPPYTVISIHNHPQSTVPSIDDLDSCYKHKYKYGVIACHDGNAFKYSIKGDFDPQYTDMLLDKVQMILYNKDKLDPKKYEVKIAGAIKELAEQNVNLEVFTWK